MKAEENMYHVAKQAENDTKQAENDTKQAENDTKQAENDSSKPARSRSLLAGALGLTLLLAACGGSANDGASGAAAEAQAEGVTEASGAPVSTASTDLGSILVNSAGLSLYGFTDDTEGVSTCEGGCAGAWPPVLVASAQVPAGLDSAVFSVIERSDGTHQLKAGKWPLYLFAGDASAGDVSGQGSGGVWFVVTPEGGLIK